MIEAAVGKGAGGMSGSRRNARGRVPRRAIAEFLGLPENSAMDEAEAARILEARAAMSAIGAQGRRPEAAENVSPKHQSVLDFLGISDNAVFTDFEIAGFLGVGVTTVSRARKSMSGPVEKVGAKRRRYREIVGFLADPGNADLPTREIADRLGVSDAAVRRAKSAYPFGATSLLRLDAIRTDGGTQIRVSLKESTVVDYAEAMREGKLFPPITVFFDGNYYWLADGFQRVAAAIMAKRKSIEAVIRMGGQREAVLFAVGANADHGDRRTAGDKRNAVIRMLRDEEWSAWSDNEIGRRCNVHHSTVAKFRREVSCEISKIGESRTVRRNGTVYSQNTANIGVKTHPKPPADESPNENDDSSDDTEIDGEDGPEDDSPPTSAEYVSLRLPLDPAEAARVLGYHFRGEAWGELLRAMNKQR